MIEIQQIDEEATESLSAYAEVAHLTAHVEALRTEAAALVPSLEGRTVWMVNSTAQGGGVAEMLPQMVSMLRELGVSVRWAVMQADDAAFFPLTKRLHNLIHGEGQPGLGNGDRELYESVNRKSAAALAEHLRPQDIVVVHDPQPMPIAPLLREEGDFLCVWRCHVGLDERLPTTRAVWRFLRPYAEAYDHAVFSLPEYVPGYLRDRITVIRPAIDPLGHKNHELSLHQVMNVLCSAGLVASEHPLAGPDFTWKVTRLHTDGSLVPAQDPIDIGVPLRPLLVQISRWDRLKGYGELLRGFAALRRRFADHCNRPDQDGHRRLCLARLILAGPETAAIQDDPESLEVFREISAEYVALEPEIQHDVAILSLPMGSRRENALIVNALQRSATVVVQNSLREGFGLTATEGMWKRMPILATQACGLRAQIRDGIDGRLVNDPRDPEEMADVLAEMLLDPASLEYWGRNAQRRVHREFLIFNQIRDWLRLLAELVERPRRRPVGEHRQAGSA